MRLPRLESCQVIIADSEFRDCHIHITTSGITITKVSRGTFQPSEIVISSGTY